MKLTKVTDKLIEMALDRPESGMGFQKATLSYQGSSRKNGLLISGAYFVSEEALPHLEKKNNARLVYVDVSNPTIEEAQSSCLYTRICVEAPSSQLFRDVLYKKTPVGSTPPFTMTTERNEEFYRLSAFKDDRRIMPDGAVAPGTYSTTDNDITAVPSGLAAVGRYALPTSLPAIHVFVIRPPAGTQVAYGTVRPDYGMAGGGVEAFFPNGCPAGSASYVRILPVK